MGVDRLAYRVTEFAEALGVSRSKGYEMVASGEVPSIRIGGSVRIPVDVAKQWLADKLKHRAEGTAA